MHGNRHGTTLHAEDQLLITGDKLNGATISRFWLAGVPFPFPGDGLLVGTDATTGQTGDHPA